MKKNKILLYIVLSIVFLPLIVIYSFIGWPRGVHTFEKNGHKIVFVEMIHVSSNKFYSNIYDKYNKEQNVVIFEGVTDKDNLLKSTSIVGKVQQYGTMFATCGQPQVHNLFSKSSRIHGDVDVNTLNKDVLAFINDPIGHAKKDESRDYQSEMIAEIAGIRNKHLVGVIKDNLNNPKDIILPWGALHYDNYEKDGVILSKGIKYYLMELGYKEIDSHLNFYTNPVFMILEKLKIMSLRDFTLDKWMPNNSVENELFSSHKQLKGNTCKTWF